MLELMEFGALHLGVRYEDKKYYKQTLKDAKEALEMWALQREKEEESAE